MVKGGGTPLVLLLTICDLAAIDRIEVHEATGGRTIYRQQNIDIHFNFIGNYYPPVEAVSEEERIAAIEAEQLRKKQE